MRAKLIAEIYDKNKLFKGKTIRYFVDPSKIAKHKYRKMMSNNERIIFGIKKYFTFHLMTNRAFYYEYDRLNLMGFAERLEKKRVPLDEIIECRLDKNFLVINGDRINLGLPIFKTEKIFMKRIESIFSVFK